MAMHVLFHSVFGVAGWRGAKSQAPRQGELRTGPGTCIYKPQLYVLFLVCLYIYIDICCFIFVFPNCYSVFFFFVHLFSLLIQRFSPQCKKHRCAQAQSRDQSYGCQYASQARARSCHRPPPLHRAGCRARPALVKCLFFCLRSY